LIANPQWSLAVKNPEIMFSRHVQIGKTWKLLLQPHLASSYHRATPLSPLGALSPASPSTPYSTSTASKTTATGSSTNDKVVVIGGERGREGSDKKKEKQPKKKVTKESNEGVTVTDPTMQKAKGKGYTASRHNREIVKRQQKVNAEHEEKAKKEGLGWRIVGATVLHRYPTILPDAEPWQVAFEGLEDKIAAKKREWFMEQVGGTESQMIPDDEPSYEEILATMPFQPASRTTEADATNDVHSADRNLAGSLFLIVKRNRSEFAWQFPQGKIQPEEKTMRSVAERVIDRAVGNVNRWFISNAPIGHYCYEYPKAIKEKRKEYGTKIFFYRAQLIAGNVKLETRLYKDFAWITRSQVGHYFDEHTAAFLTAILPE